MENKNYLFPDFDKLIFGGDYNPEQWRHTPEIWDEDMRLMKLAHWNEATLGVFSWAELEPQEGVYDFSVPDAIFEKAEKNGLKIILATPSGAKPRWMAEKYPETMRTADDRHRALYGRRHNHCFSSPVYREKIANINRLLAERYSHSPALLCWHISNEVNGECHCEHCRRAFVEFLRKKYDNDIEKLNLQWWTRFWSHRYDNFEQADPPSSIGENAVHGLTIDWKRFVTAQTADFMKHEIAAIKEYSQKPITTNLMGFFTGIDYRELAKTVDFVSWDNYPNWELPWGDVGQASWIGMTHDCMRSLKRKNFLLMESTPSLVNWKDINKLARPGKMRISSLQAIAHGSDSVQYFQWRKSRGSSEKMHGAVVDHYGKEDTRVFSEVAALGEELEKLSAVAGTKVISKAAILYDWDTIWALQDMQGMQKNSKKYGEATHLHYGAFHRRGINVDLIGRKDSYDEYDVIVAPMMYICEEETAGRLASFVENGGTLVGTYAMAQVNENDLCHLGGWPCGVLMDVFGLRAEELDTLYPEESVKINAYGEEYTAKDYCEILKVKDATVLGTYGSEFYKDTPCFTVNEYGKGKAYYVAFRDKSGTFTDKLIGEIAADKKLPTAINGKEIPKGVTAKIREGAGEKYLFLLNFSGKGQTVELDGEYTVITTGEKISSVYLPLNGGLVLKA